MTRDALLHGREPTTTADRTIEEGAYRKVTWRLVRFLMVCYVGTT